MINQTVDEILADIAKCETQDELAVVALKYSPDGLSEADKGRIEEAVADQLEALPEGDGSAVTNWVADN